MKYFNHILITVVFALGTVIFIGTGCKNKCGNTTCQNGGTCSSNKCICPVGYSGNACQNGWSDVAVGTYNCSRSNCKPAVTGSNTWQSAVTKASNNGGYTIYISNFDNSNTTLAATIDSNISGISRISISPAAGSFGVNATGTYSNNSINLQFTSAGAGGVSGYSCYMTMKKI